MNDFWRNEYYNSKVAYYIHGQYDLNYVENEWNATGN